jgi:hypothetical protein
MILSLFNFGNENGTPLLAPLPLIPVDMNHKTLEWNAAYFQLVLVPAIPTTATRQVPLCRPPRVKIPSGLHAEEKFLGLGAAFSLDCP